MYRLLTLIGAITCAACGSDLDSATVSELTDAQYVEACEARFDALGETTNEGLARVSCSNRECAGGQAAFEACLGTYQHEQCDVPDLDDELRACDVEVGVLRACYVAAANQFAQFATIDCADWEAGLADVTQPDGLAECADVLAACPTVFNGAL